ncbi:MAG TPA: S8 family serine peptidase, partial [Candidatus Methanoperedens sp.]
MKDTQRKAVHLQFMFSQENTIAQTEKISKSFKEGVYKYNVFLTVIIITSLLVSIPSAYAVLVDSSQEKKASVNDQSIDLPDQSMFLSNELLIKVKSSSKDSIKKSPEPDDTGIISLNALNKKHGVSRFEQVAKRGEKSKRESMLFDWYRITLDATKKTITKKSIEFDNFKKIMDSYKSDPSIDVVEPNYIVTIFLTPNDPYFFTTGSWGQSYSDLWGIRKINTESAWNLTNGSSSIIVAGIDTGVDRNHEDLKDNMWVNTAEIPNNGIDDDENGYVDDFYGWDWTNNDNDPMDDHGHGTHTAGTIAAVGNNGIGVAGVNWKSRIMALKFLNSGGSGSLSDGVLALQYAADMEANVSSNSWGCMCNSVMMDDAVQYEHEKGMIMVAAAGNSNADALDFSPASADMTITVAASDYNDAKASFSNWGQKIDVAAPGVDILSTRAAINPMCTVSRTVGTNYCRVSGTSMATPHVAGLAALILSKYPSLTNEEVRQIIRAGAIDLGMPGKDRDFGYGRIDANGSIYRSNTKPLSPIITSPRSRTTASGTAFQIKGSIPGPNFASYKIEVGAGREPAEWITLVTSAEQVINATLGTVDTTQINDGTSIFRITATDKNGKTYQYQVNDIEVDNFDTGITSPVALVSQGIINISGNANTRNGLPFSKYKLEWGMGSAPASWSTQGINLVDNGLQSVNNSRLATWDTSNLTNGQIYTLRLTVIAATGSFSRYSIMVTADKDVVKGWPKRFETGTDCFYCEATPTIADIDNDGSKEVIIAAPTNRLYIYRKDGTDFPGFPVSIASGEFFYRPPNVADLDGDGKKEIVAASTASTQRSKVYVIRSNGTFYPGWPIPGHVYTKESGDGTPTIADLDGDGKKDLIIIDPYYKMMHTYHLDGTELTGFPKTLSINDSNDYPGAPLIADLDKDGKPEIAYGYSDKFYLFDNKGNLLPGWPFAAPPYDN